MKTVAPSKCLTVTLSRSHLVHRMQGILVSGNIRMKLFLYLYLCLVYAEIHNFFFFLDQSNTDLDLVTLSMLSFKWKPN